MRLALGIATLAVATGLGSTAWATPQGTYVVRTPTAGPRFGPGPQHRIIYMNRHGGTIHSGDDDSSSDTSSIPNYSTSNLTPWELGDSGWTELMACTKSMFSRFDVEITDVDPGAVPHIESMTSGYPQDIGWGSGVGGVAPMNGDCSVVETAIVFTFAGVYGDDVASICETVAQEVSHALGLDHEYLCEDPMTYLYGCGVKTFKDVDADCGEYSARSCACGGSTQNSVQVLYAVLGMADQEPPSIDITSPQEGAMVDPGFTVTAVAADDREVTKVDLYIDGAYVDNKAAPPYTFTTAATLAPGAHTIEVRAYDGAGNVTPDTVHATVNGGGGGDCTSDAECATGEHCQDGACVPDGGGPGQPGDPCTSGDDCASGICTDGTCGEGDDGTGPGNATGGCTVAAQHRGLGALTALLAVLFVLLIPRRRPQP